jgi:nitrite reductase/ring-hydroxylating ferredoxin subunit
MHRSTRVHRRREAMATYPPLSRGKLEGDVVECPLHFARYDVRSGALLSGPVAAPVVCYTVRVEGDTVYVKQ